MIANPLTIMYDLGQHADLLLESDQWLENQRRDIATRMSLLAGQLKHIQTAQQYKRQIQQVNKVAVKTVRKDPQGNIIDEEIRIATLPDAIRLLRTAAPPDVERQIHAWNADGYDIETSAQHADAHE